MAELLTSAQMRAVERAAIDSGEVSGLELMERAGQGVVAAIFEEWPELALSSYKAVVLCGPGNNGGDGFVIARLLKQRGWEVEVFLYGDPEKLPPDAKANYERWREVGEVAPLNTREFRHSDCDVVVDALFGTGVSRALSGEALSTMSQLAGANGDRYDKIVCVDCPSGLCLDSGRVLAQPSNPALADLPIQLNQLPRSRYPYGGIGFAALTVTFDSPKCGHFLDDGPFLCGKLRVVDIGVQDFRENSRRDILDKSGQKTGRAAKLVRRPEVCLVHMSPIVKENRSFAQPLMLWGKDPQDHKYTHGHPLILSGLSGKTGAARLSARAALRVGAGLVTLGTPHEAVTEVAAQITTIMLTEIDTPEILTRVLTDKRLNALCIGPGFGVERAGEFLPYALAAKRATVLDADALTALSESETGFADLHANCVLTPHAGEFKRLFPDLATKLAEPPIKGPAYSKVDATREAAKRAGCTVLFKGPDTVIASPNGRCSINAAVYDRAAPWLATAGSGDVLAGLITGLLARGLAPHHAAETAAWLHVEAARSFGPGLIAEDLPEELPKVFRALGL
ncbi:bifunctional ADP-dependent NAD(P)H-hydrate dehydratase/NAD(P)H-hydrate epimerase [Celeribacter ethanolicus]|uniref:Bifunctional NAD(P)H-hydrate repair enzyme n=1 Tax=Celeribacter ethanolicus TaxID=1758178 RepID=A0A291GB22_9RHOB|nr:NAD(P)H-hydrate dehydratase [Celeribacter ethanolicus]ATG47264.1 bifunctional ADP-dependent NAD(P)H-hydrate dehydratase/NAD(P)H-hydrate epimerase [Celeribacter ethanolicus]